MVTQTQNLSREMAHAYLTGTAPQTDRLSSPACPTIITKYEILDTNYYAKQTQFPKSQNEIKLLFNKGL